ncbi:MAG: NERD domain-containing protein, partial [Thermanaerothrix sp.]|nr:NERD domain-containing protein [Thermanaerothrix sp.]
MAEVIGFLRREATYGEQETLKYLRSNLPKEFVIYVEPPLRKKRDVRYPDFVVLTNYGYVVLEVKDWVNIVSANPHEAVIRGRDGKERREPNPVTTTRAYALILDEMICANYHQEREASSIPFSYAAVLIHQPPAVISRLRQVWGAEFVWGREDLKNPDVLLSRLRHLFPVERLRPLTREEIDHVRRVINPVFNDQGERLGTVIEWTDRTNEVRVEQELA